MTLQWSCGCAYMSHYENVPFEVPKGWCWTSLDNTCTLFGRIGFRGYTKDDLVDSTGAITLSPSNIVEGIMNYEKCTYISWEKYEESPEIQVQNEDILLVKTGSSYGKCAYVESLPKEATINPQFVVLKFIGCNPKFLTYCLQSNYARKQYDEFVLGTAIPTFTQVALGAMTIPIPPLKEQERIVAEVEKWLLVVDSLDENTNELRAAISLAKSKILDLAIRGKLVPQDANDESASELLKRINPKAVASCDNPHYENVPSNWVCTTMGSIFQHNTGKALNKSVSVEGTLQPYLTTSNVYWNTFDLSVVKEMRFKESEIKKCTVRKGDLLVCEGGDIGRSAIWNKDYSICIQNHLHRLRPKGDIVPLLYLYFIMYLKLTNNLEGKGIGLQGFSSGLLDKLEVPLPPYNEQIRIVKKIQEAFNTLDFIAESLI